MPVRSILLVTAVVSAFLVTGSPPAQAGPERSRDGGGDVVSRSQFSDAKPTRAEPARKVGDVVASRVTLGEDLVVTLKLRSLAPTGDQQFSWTVVTSADEEPGGWSGSLGYAGSRRSNFSFLDPIAYDPGCARATVDRPARTVTLTVPADCLGDPAWVRVAAGTQTYAGGREYWDDARSPGLRLSGFVLGPKVTAQ